MVDDEAARPPHELLAARKLVDFAGPHGWEHSAIDLGAIDVIDAPRGRGLARQAAPGAAGRGAAGEVHGAPAASSTPSTAARTTPT